MDLEKARKNFISYKIKHPDLSDDEYRLVFTDRVYSQLKDCELVKRALLDHKILQKEQSKKRKRSHLPLFDAETRAVAFNVLMQIVDKGEQAPKQLDAVKFILQSESAYDVEYSRAIAQKDVIGEGDGVALPGLTIVRADEG